MEQQFASTSEGRLTNDRSLRAWPEIAGCWPPTRPKRTAGHPIASGSRPVCAGRRTRTLIHSLSTLIPILCFCSAVPNAWGDGFIEITAEIELIKYGVNKAGDPPDKKRSYLAVCILGRTEWSIDTDFLEDAREVHYFDGTNTYCFTKGLKRVDPKLAPETIFHPLDPALVFLDIIPGQHPLGNMGANVPWLAFCSANYLKQPDRILPLPGANIRYRADAFGYIDSTTIFEGAGGLPNSVELFTSYKQFKKGLDDPRLVRNDDWKLIYAHHSQTIRDGELALRYVAETTTNFFGWRLPSRFSLTQFGVGRDGTWQPDVGAIGRVLSLRQRSEINSRPFEADIMYATDFRFRHDKKLLHALYYPATNGNILATTDPFLQQLFQKSIDRAPTMSDRSSAKWGLYVLLIAVLLFPPVLLLRQRSKPQRSVTD